MKSLWFKRKKYGWGWYPASWQGWVVLLFFIGILLLNDLRINANPGLLGDPYHVIVPQTAVLVILLLIICYWKGEEPRWQWGESEQKPKKSERRKDGRKNH